MPNANAFNYQIINTAMPGSRHNNGLNVLFNDWHVEWVKYSRISWAPVHNNGDGQQHPLSLGLGAGPQPGITVQ